MSKGRPRLYEGLNEQVRDLHRTGHTIREIVDIMQAAGSKVSRATVHRIVKRGDKPSPSAVGCSGEPS